MGLVLFTGCNQKTKPIVPPVVNVDVIDVTPELGVFDWQQNDELIKSEKAVKMIVVKSKRVLVLFNKEGDVLSRHRISLGSPIGTKLKQGDKKNT